MKAFVLNPCDRSWLARLPALLSPSPEAIGRPAGPIPVALERVAELIEQHVEAGLLFVQRSSLESSPPIDISLVDSLTSLLQVRPAF
jgi:hypothetical protein